ncbi:hypothetical protein SCHPADRAFT_111370 [Schizopora paradoxa]|uniref:Coenzyme Q-binding protein COQ10 START domain-containing protein n=1 Tax=Schizopora paradoxa TaxID=27342 RepID=A0A0H2S368_9AGAM|nr:hypothetical protein SCHPADRAFT_111370 [Schizopora paradoxa]
MTSNLPDAPERGNFTVHVRKEIEAPVEVVWKILLDFPSYHEWNPFVRDMTIVSAVTRQKEQDLLDFG